MSFAPINGGGILGRLYGGGLGGIFGQPQNPGGLLGVAALEDAKKRQQMAMAASLLQASGPSPQKVGFGQALGGAMMAGQQAGDQANLQALQAEMMKRQMQPKPQSPLEVSPGSTLYDPATRQALYTAPKSSETSIGNYNPGDYTPKSWAEFVGGDFKNPGILERYETPREQNPYFRDVTRINPDGSTSQGVFNARSGQYSWPNPIVPPGTKSRVEAEGKAIGEAQGAQTSKAPVVASMDYVLSEFEKQLPLTPQGGLMGIGGKVGGITDYKDAARFDNLREQLSTELRTVYRIPGEGTLSDREQAQYGLQLPSRDNPREVNERIIADLRERTRLRTQTPIGFGPAQPSAPQAPAQAPQSGGTDINSLLDKYAPKK